MTRKEKKFLRGIAGGIAGFVTGVASVPFYVATDCLAAVAYPVAGAALGAGLGLNSNHPVVGAVAGAAVGTASVPMAPLNALNRWWVMPLYFAGVGAGIGVSL